MQRSDSDRGNALFVGRWALALVLALATALVACSDSNDPAAIPPGGQAGAGTGGNGSGGGAGGQEPAGPGDVTGRVTFPDGTTPIVGVEVAIADGAASTAQSGGDGTFVVKDVTPGSWSGTISKGIFSAAFDVVVTADAPTDVGTISMDPSSARLAVVTGIYDSIEDILTGLDFEVDLYQEESGLLEVSDKLDDYDAVFINCATVFPTGQPAQSAAAVSAFKTWLAAGGKLYISDWASANAYAIDPDFGVYAKYGPAIPVAVPADVVDTDLAAAVGDQVMVLFDLPAWAVIIQTGPNTTTHIKLAGEHLSEMTEYDPPGDGLPLMISAPQGTNGGVLFFTSFHNDAQATDTMRNVLSYVAFFDF